MMKDTKDKKQFSVTSYLSPRSLILDIMVSIYDDLLPCAVLYSRISQWCKEIAHQMHTPILLFILHFFFHASWNWWHFFIIGWRKKCNCIGVLLHACGDMKDQTRKIIYYFMYI